MGGTTISIATDAFVRQGIRALYFPGDGGATPLEQDLRQVPVCRRSGRQALDTAHRPAPPQAPPPLQRVVRGARGGYRRDAVAAAQGTGAGRGSRAPRPRRAAG